jgi:hypothetical protein
LGEHGVVIIIAEDKRLAYHKLVVTFSSHCDKKLSESRLYSKGDGKGNSSSLEPTPDIVDANHDAEDVGFGRDSRSGGIEVAYGVAGDSGIEDIGLCVIFAKEDWRRGRSEAEGLERQSFCHVGDVTDKEKMSPRCNSIYLPYFKFYHQNKRTQRI